MSVDANGGELRVFEIDLGMQFTGTDVEYLKFLQGMERTARNLGGVVLSEVETSNEPYVSSEAIRKKLGQNFEGAFDGIGDRQKAAILTSFSDQGLTSVGDLIALGWSGVDDLPGVGNGAQGSLRKYFAGLDGMPFEITNERPTVTQLARMFDDLSQIPAQVFLGPIDLKTAARAYGRRVSVMDALDRTAHFKGCYGEDAVAPASLGIFAAGFLRLRDEMGRAEDRRLGAAR